MAKKRLVKAKPLTPEQPATPASGKHGKTGLLRPVPVPKPEAVPKPQSVPTPEAAPTPETPQTPAPGKLARPVPVTSAAPTMPRMARPVPISEIDVQQLEQAKAPAVRDELVVTDKEMEKDSPPAGSPMSSVFHTLFVDQPSWVVSAVVHMALLLLLAFCVFQLPFQQPMIVATMHEVEEMETFEEEIEQHEIIIPESTEKSTLISKFEEALSVEALQSDLEVVDQTDPGADAASQELTDYAVETAPVNELLSEVGTGTGKGDGYGTGKGLYGSGAGLGGRGMRRGTAVAAGATKESEEAVDRALKWLAAHQCRDGSWNYAHQNGLCRRRCRNPGSALQAQYAATAMGLLPFLGAGQTHLQGKYKHNVAAALNYLIRNQGAGGSFHEPEGRMYAHGLVTLALCEALAMQIDGAPSPGDAEPGEKPDGEAEKPVILVHPGKLASAAQGAIYFIEKAQHPGGGWRYNPGQAGDTSVVGWQVMALKSGQMARLGVNHRTLARAHVFLNSVASDQYGSRYGYAKAGDREGQPTTSAIGLLCRMYAGWPVTHPGLVAGTDHLSQSGPNTSNLYYSYYATQVMHHFGGDKWKRWNATMRESLVRTQSKEGHEEGSWSLGSKHSNKGGRLYDTSLSTLILEVYYRHMKIYRVKAVDMGKMVPVQEGLPDADEEEPFPL